MYFCTRFGRRASCSRRVSIYIWEACLLQLTRLQQACLSICFFVLDLQRGVGVGSGTSACNACTAALLLLYCCFTAALLLLYCCSTAALLLLYCGFTAALLRLYCETWSAASAAAAAASSNACHFPNSSNCQIAGGGGGDAAASSSSSSSSYAYVRVSIRPG